MPEPSAHLHLFLEIRRELVGYAAKITGDAAQAEDIVQEAWIRFNPRDGAIRPSIDQPVAYLYRIVRNLALDLQRSRAREQGHQAEPPQWLLPTQVEDPADTWQHGMALQRLSTALAAMPENSRLALELHRFSGFTLAQIATQLGTSVSTAHRLLRDALVVLARVMDDAGDGQGNNKERAREQ
jgi:RNA polymerase sigma-70 factor (ECF subfamily)